MTARTHCPARFMLLTLFAMIFLCSSAHAQHIGYRPVAARQIALGGTGIAAARAGEAAWTNPARLLEAQGVELWMAFRYREDFVYAEHPNAALWDGTLQAERRVEGHATSAPLFSVLVPFTLNEHPVAFGLTVARPIELTYAGSDFTGGPYAVSPTLAVQVHDRVRVGAAVHVWRGQYHDPDDVYTVPGSSGGSMPYVHGDSDPNVATRVGVTWRAWQRYQQYKLDLGLSIQQGFNLDLEDPTPYARPGIEHVAGSAHLLMPWEIAMGAAWTIKNETILTCDVITSQWTSDFFNTAGRVEVASGEFDLELNRWTVRAGFEHRLGLEPVDILLRAGGWRGELPIWHHDAGLERPELVVATGMSAGVGLEFPLLVHRLDIGYQHTHYPQWAGPQDDYDGDVDGWVSTSQHALVVQAGWMLDRLFE